MFLSEWREFASAATPLVLAHLRKDLPFFLPSFRIVA